MVFDSLRGAVAFLTRVPVGARPIDDQAWSWSPAWFPFVGLWIGAVSYWVFRFAAPVGAFGAAALTIAVGLLVTGALHEDGLADSADALLGAVSRERALEILKDSRIGSYGAATLTLALLLRVSLLSQLGFDDWLPFLLAPSLGRLGPLWLLTVVGHAAPNQCKNKDFMGVGRSRAACATLFMLVACATMLGVAPNQWPRVAAAWITTALVTIYVGRLARRRLGGITGDLLGAAEQIGEIGILLVFAYAT